MKVNEIRNLTTEEINNKIKETKEELFNLRFQQATGNLEKPSRIKDLRHLVARLKTVLRERELNEGNTK
jgi:large subunit ribosomal protein L29